MTRGRNALGYTTNSGLPADFRYRQSPTPLFAQNSLSLSVGGRQVYPSILRWTTGMALLVLDTTGQFGCGAKWCRRKKLYRRITQTTPYWRDFLRASGLNSRIFAPSSRSGRRCADGFALAWTGPLSFDQVDVPIRVTRAAFHGDPVYYTKDLSLDKAGPDTETALTRSKMCVV